MRDRDLDQWQVRLEHRPDVVGAAIGGAAPVLLDLDHDRV